MPILLLLGVLAAEILLFIEVGGVIGLWPTLGSIFATAFIGGIIFRHQGLSTLARAREHIERREIPVAEMLDGMALFVSAFLLLSPGYITDGLGGLLLIPPLRHFLLRRAVRLMEVRIAGARVDPAPRRDDGVIDGEFEDVTPPDAKPDDGHLPPPNAR